MVIPGGTYGPLSLLWLTPATLELYLHSWEMTTFVTLAIMITGKQGSVLMTPSGMLGGVVSQLLQFQLPTQVL